MRKKTERNHFFDWSDPTPTQCTHPMELIVDSVDWMKLYFFINFPISSLFFFYFSLFFFSCCFFFYFSLLTFLSFFLVVFSCFSPCPSSSLSPCYFFFFSTCVGIFSLEQERDSKKHCTLFQGVDNFSFKQYHHTMWRQVWTNKTCLKNVTKFGNFSSEFFCLFFCVFFTLLFFHFGVLKKNLPFLHLFYFLCVFLIFLDFFSMFVHFFQSF